MSTEMRKYIDTFKQRLTESENLNISDVSDSINLTYPEAFDKYINNKSVIGRYHDRPLINRYDKWEPYYAYVEGIKFENGYVWASHGGGCSGEDCNQTFIISPDNKFVAGFDW